MDAESSLPSLRGTRLHAGEVLSKQQQQRQQEQQPLMDEGQGRHPTSPMQGGAKGSEADDWQGPGQVRSDWSGCVKNK